MVSMDGLRTTARVAVVTLLAVVSLLGCGGDDDDAATPVAGIDETTVSSTTDQPSSTSAATSSSTTATTEAEPTDTEPATPADLDSWTWVRREAADVGLPEFARAFEVTDSSFGDGLFVVSGYRQRSGAADGFVEYPLIWTTVDGTSWSAVDVALAESGEGLYSVAHGSTGFAAVGEVTIDAIGAPPGGAGVVWISSDGLDWSREAPEEWASFVPRSVTPTADGGFLAAGATGRFEAAVWRSDDGVTWTEVAVFEESGGIGLEEVAGGPSGYVAAGRLGEGENQRAFLAWSADGLSWEDVSVDQEVFPTNSSALEAVAGSDGFVVAGRDFGSDSQSALWTSRDGAIWQHTPITTEVSFVYIGDMVAVPQTSILLVGALADIDEPWNETGAIWEVSSIEGIPTAELLNVADVPLGLGIWNVAADATQIVAIGRDEQIPSGGDLVVWSATPS